jgi:hypothetical protein
MCRTAPLSTYASFILVAFFLTSLVGGQPSAARASEKSCVEPVELDTAAPILVSGRIEQQKMWGLPGFGENPKRDQQYYTFVLALDYPLPILWEELGSTSVVLLDRIQISWSAHDSRGYNDLLALLGKHVIADGTLRSRFAPSDATMAVMSANEIVPVGKTSCDGRVLSPKP